MKQLIFTLVCIIYSLMGYGQEMFTVQSPDSTIKVTIECGDALKFTVEKNGKIIMEPSYIGMLLDDDQMLSYKPRRRNATSFASFTDTITAPIYKKEKVIDNYNKFTIHFEDRYSVVFRCYNEGIAYHFITNLSNKILTVKDELAVYNFPEGTKAYAAYANKGKSGDFASQFCSSFENTYEYEQIAKLDSGRLAFFPILLELPDSQQKVCITETNLQDYPGMYVVTQNEQFSLRGIWAPVPVATEQGGHNNLQQLVKLSHNYIAETIGKREYPWRIFAITNKDMELLNNDMAYLMAEPSRIEDTSWIKPGKVAWEWWNDWSLSGVNFKSGINNDTYKEYIDFASDKGLEYVILDEGWAVNKQADLLQVVPEINLSELISYGKRKNVNIILWAGYWAFHRDMARIAKHYADMGVKGFKIDFLDRDDQQMIKFMWDAAKVCADNKLLVDFHGVCKPFGIQRTYPNVINFEGVHGLEQMKWSPSSVDQVAYDLQFPFIRMLAGPVDYTQGAMRNASRKNYRPIYGEPMSQGTRCRQLSQYIIFDSPLNMLCDSPSQYAKEEECTDYIADVPTTWDETIPLDSRISKYINVARRKGETWYIGGMNDWNHRNQNLDLSFLPKGEYQVTLFTDGMNADKVATDYKKETFVLPTNKQLNVTMQPGGGYAAIIKPIGQLVQNSN